MDSHDVVLEISSDEEVNWAAHVGRGITDDGDDDHNWLAELLEEVNKADSGENGDSDEVVVVSELLSAKVPRKRSKSRSKSSPLVDLDDDCVILENDPDKAVEIRDDDPNDGDEDDGSDDLRVVGEKGQVACRDYPHPRHLCIKFPFSSTPNQNHCNQCYCYVCDSLAPCLHWGNGSLSFDHCHATDKDEFWRHQRKTFKNGSKSVPKITNMPLLDHLPPPGLVRPPSALVQPAPVAHNQFLRPCLPTNFGVSSGFLPRNKYQPSFISRARDRVHHNYSLGTTQVHRPVFKRPGVVGAFGNRYPNGSHRGNLRIPTPVTRNPINGMVSGQNQYLGLSNLVNGSVSFPQNRTSPLLQEPSTFPSQFSGQPTPDTSFDFPPSFQPRMDLDPYLENSSVFQPQMVLSQASYIAPVQPQVPPPPPPPPISVTDYNQNQTHQESRSQSVSDYNQNPTHQEIQSQSQRVTVVPSFTDQSATMAPSFADHWQQPAAESCQLEPAATTDEPIVAGLVDYQYDNWMFNNQVVEPGSMDVLAPYPYGFNEFSPDSTTFIDTGPIFDL